MLLEKNAYPNDFPMNIRVGKIIEDPIHYHQDIEFVLVLSGEIKLKNGAFHYLLHEGDVFTNNGHEIHSIEKSSGDNVVALISVSNLFFTQYFPALTKSSYRTYNEYEGDPRRDNIRKMLLMLLLDYYKRTLGYKQKCTDLMLALIEYLNACFNLFTYKNQTIVNVDSGNQVQIQRITRIINHIYECHAQKLTLNELAELEHLNPFYISHIIKESTGMSFQELLGFARAEWSEIPLLETNKPIARIAKEVGFSGTSLYEKHFIKWFGHSPQAHRDLFRQKVKSPLRTENILVFPANQSIHLIQQNLSLLQSLDKSMGTVKNIKLDVLVNVDAEPLYQIAPEFHVSITTEVYSKLGHRLFEHLSRLRCKRVHIVTNEKYETNLSDARGDGRGSDPLLIQLTQSLIAKGYEVEPKEPVTLKGVESYGLDSIAGLICLLKENLQKRQGAVQANLMDRGNPDMLLKGMHGLLTSAGVPKPTYYGHVALSMVQGSLLTWGKYYSVVRLNGESEGYAIIAFHFNDEIQQLCGRNTTVHETHDVLKRFNDELDINFSLRGLNGEYVVTRYGIDSRNNVFDYMAKLDFANPGNQVDVKSALLYSVPTVEIYKENATRELGLNISFQGAAAQFVIISKVVKEGISE